MWRPLLRSLDRWVDLKATRMEWEHCFERGITASFESYFVSVNGEATAVPCRRKPSCGGVHEVRELSRGRFVAVPVDPECPCSSFPVTPEDLDPLRFDFDRLLGDFAEALTITGGVEHRRPRPRLARLGVASHADWPVFLGLPRKPSESLILVERVRQEVDGRSLLLFPTPARLDVDTRATANARNVGLAFLDDLLVFEPRKGWLATRELEEVFPAPRARAPKLRRLQLPPKTSWRQIVVTLLKNGRISVSLAVGGHAQSYTRAEMGFETQKGGEATAWTALVGAATLGCIPVSRGHASGERDEKARNRSREITAALRRVVDVEGQAFKLSNEAPFAGAKRSRVRGYWPLFKLRHEDDRFERDLGNYPRAAADLAEEDADD